MEKVFLLYTNCGPEVELYGVFSTREDASRYVRHFHSEAIDSDDWFGEYSEILSIQKEERNKKSGE